MRAFCGGWQHVFGFRAIKPLELDPMLPLAEVMREEGVEYWPQAVPYSFPVDPPILD